MNYEPALRTEEKVPSLFQPDTLLPAEYCETLRSRTQLEPERRLMLAVLSDAITCFQKNLFARQGRRNKIFREAEEWIMERDIEGLHSFETICEVLGLDSEYLRNGLLRWKEERLAERSGPKVSNVRPYFFLTASLPSIPFPR
jgi:hypothetical protein